MSFLIIFLAGIITGYTVADEKDPIEVVVDHNVEVSVPCVITLPPKPLMPLTDTGNEEENIFEKSQKALAEIEVRRGYEDNLESAAESCK